MKKMILGCFKLIAALVSVVLTAAFLLTVGLSSGRTQRYSGEDRMDLAVMDRFDLLVNNGKSAALEGVLAVEKVFWLKDDDLIAPEPDQSKYGKTTDPSSLDWLLEDAQKLLNGQKTLFSTETVISPGSTVQYYLDETIFAVTWKQGIGGSMYTISEVKISHPSQLRRYLAGGQYGSPVHMETTQMSREVNAVVASSGDFYGFRNHGVIVYDGIVRRVNSRYVDTCYINEEGQMLFSYRGQLPDVKSAQKFVDENNVRFSVAFGPVLVDNGQRIYTSNYVIGEINDEYARAILAEKDDLHYLMIAVNNEMPYGSTQTLDVVANYVEQMGVRNAYTLDGGQTAVIAMNGKLINKVVYGFQRRISDIIYFATAMPDGS